CCLRTACAVKARLHRYLPRAAAVARRPRPGDIVDKRCHGGGSLLSFAPGSGILILQPVSETGRRSPVAGGPATAEPTCFTGKRGKGGPLKKSKRSHGSSKPPVQLTQLPMKPLAMVIAMYCSGAAAADSPAAPDAPPGQAFEEVIVTGLRQSLVTSETIK